MSPPRPRTEHALRRDLSVVSRLLWERGWVANHDGNASARLGPGRILVTPTSTSKRLCEPSSMCVVDEKGRHRSGATRPPTEVGLHLCVYAERTDVEAVVHAHPPHATALAVSGRALPCFLPEAVVSLGAQVPLVPLASPGEEAERALRPFVAAHDAVLLEGHGAMAWGTDVEQAYLRLELVEHLARIALLATAAGGPRSLPGPLVDSLLARRRQIFGR
ncbi:MAG: class II aldolase/adducin family protein [Myxococcota bacterium]|nr:class II aldolase/adducin family protein [Myxococcota bacterium]MDW8362371.1 class II aldolase/adducin family protein [Myxococcales bacterium]